jgi:DNA-binding transcriptional LysR family regulator
MELHQLRYLVAVADAGSFTAAAGSLHVSQSGVSAQVAKLEHEVGHRLLRRGGMPVRLTDAGAQILPHARAALDAVSTISSIADELSGMVRGNIRLGTVIGCTIPGYLAGFADFRRAHPGVQVSVVEDNSDRLITDLETGRLDVALVAHAEPLPDAVAAQTLVREPLAAVVPDDHPWASKTSVTCADLASTTVLSLPIGTGVRSALASTCAAERVEVTPDVAAHSPESILSLVGLGSGVGLLTPSMAGGHPTLTAVPVARSTRSMLSLAIGPAPSAAARAMATALAARLLPTR